MTFIGNFPTIGKKHGSPHEAGDWRTDPHNSVINVTFFSAHSAVQEFLTAMGWSGAFPLTEEQSNEAKLYLRQHVDPATGTSMLASLDALLRSPDLGLLPPITGDTGSGGSDTPVPAGAPTSFKQEVEKALRLAGTEFHEAIKQARADGVATEAQETEFLKRRLALLVALNEQVQALPDAVNPGEPITANSEGQAECDALWDYIAEIRESFVRQRMTGYTVDPYWAAKGDTSYFKSLIDAHLFNGLNAMSNVALVLGLRGRWVMMSLFGAPPRPVRDAYYISPFQSWASQDDVARKFSIMGTNGALAIGGQQS